MIRGVRIPTATRAHPVQRSRRALPFKPACAAKAGDGAPKTRRTRKNVEVTAAPRQEEPSKATSDAGKQPTVTDSKSGSTSTSRTAALPSLQRLESGSEALKALLERRAQQRSLKASQGAVPSSSSSSNVAPATPQHKPSAISNVVTHERQSVTTPSSLAAAGGTSLLSVEPSSVSEARRAVRVRFWLNLHVNYGEYLVVIGGCPELGSWIISQAAVMNWSDGDMWNATVEIPAGGVYEYKYVIVGPGGHAAAWQAGNNSVLAVRRDDESLEVYDNWYGSPGAQVTCAGAEPVTRENRLLAWASEIEATMGRQRQELRRARMELASAQEEARVAREEARRAKAALAVSEAERTAATTTLRRVEATNKILQAQLIETTSSFKSAIETAVELLEKASTRRSSSAKATPAAMKAEKKLHVEVVGEADGTAPAASTAANGSFASGKSNGTTSSVDAAVEATEGRSGAKPAPQGAGSTAKEVNVQAAVGNSAQKK